MTTVTERPGPLRSAEAGGAAPGPTLGRLVRGELLKARTTNLWWILAICMFVATALALLANIAIAYFQIFEAHNPPNFAEQFPPGEVPPPDLLAEMEAEWRATHQLGPILIRTAANIFTSGQYFGLLIAMLFGTLLVAGEYFHQTATTTFLVAPRRTRVIVAKVLAAFIVAGLAWLVTTAIDLAAGTVFYSVEGETNSLDVWSVQRAILMNLPAYALWALLGMGLGALIRHQIAATLVGAGLYLIGSQVVQLVFFLTYEFWIKQAWVLQAMIVVPSVASSIMITPERQELTTTDENVIIYAPQWWVGALVLVAYGVAATGLGTLLVRRRDVG